MTSHGFVTSTGGSGCAVCGADLYDSGHLDYFRLPTVACQLCGKPTGMLATKLCDGCWELKTRIEADPEIAQRVLTNLTTTTTSTKEQQ